MIGLDAHIICFKKNHIYYIDSGYFPNTLYLNKMKFLDNLPKEKFTNNNMVVLDCLSESLNLESNEIIDYLLFKFTESLVIS